MLGCVGYALVHAQTGGGASTGEAHAPTYDARHRPITAGGYVAAGEAVFEDVTRAAGLASWQHHVGSTKRTLISESLGSGVALLDFDGDGWLDIYLVNGSTVEALEGRAVSAHAALFRNNHDGTFTDVTRSAGVANDRWGVGAIAADFDNDGWPDLYVTNLGKNRLYHNNRNGTFTDIAESAGVALGGWSTGATAGDFDGDGLLDLFVPGYTAFDFAKLPQPGSNSVAANTCTFRGVATFCGPRGLLGAPDHLFRNRGDGTFVEVSEQAHVADKPGYYGLASLFVDLDGDGLPELLVGNDSTPNYLYQNMGNGTFQDESFESGFAVNGQGRETATMGVAAADFKNSGNLGLALTNFSDDYKLLYEGDGGLSFSDISAKAGIADLSTPFLGWGVGFADFDRDGLEDLFFVNGHVYPQVDQQQWGTSFAQRPLLFRNAGNAKFRPVEAVEGSGLAQAITGRGAAFGDLFNKGRIDVVINNLEGPPTLLRNVSSDRHHWIEFSLRGTGKSNREAIGARVTLVAGPLHLRRDVLCGGSFASSSDPRVFFGLGDATTVESVEITWPDHSHQSFSGLAADHIYTIVEGERTARPQATSK
ncbi:CRTAC1 family protein [Terriglobus aquaticus]